MKGVNVGADVLSVFGTGLLNTFGAFSSEKGMNFVVPAEAGRRVFSPFASSEKTSRLSRNVADAGVRLKTGEGFESESMWTASFFVAPCAFSSDLGPSVAGSLTDSTGREGFGVTTDLFASSGSTKGTIY